MTKKIFAAYLTILCISAWAIHDHGHQKMQSKDKPAGYEAYWQRVDSLAKKGLTKSALAEVMKIYDRSRQENNMPEFLKAVIHRMKFESYTEEESIQKSIGKIKDDLSTTGFPASAILHSLLGETYWSFYQQNRWKFMNRSETQAVSTDDINTWDLRKLIREVHLEFRLSLQNKSQLQKIQVNVFDNILVKGKPEEARKFRPTLYDFLAHRALDHFMEEESGLTEAIDKYRIDGAWYLNDIDLFLNFGLPAEDSLDSKYNAIFILQDLLRFHQNDAHPGALIDANLKRLKFVHQQLTIVKKDSLYLLALGNLAKRYHEYPGSSDALYEMANLIYSKGSEYQAGDPDSIRMLKRDAEALCDSAITQFPYSQGGLNCKYLKALILEKQLSFDVEKVNIPDRPFLGTLTFRNLNKAYVRIVQIRQNEEGKEAGMYGERLVQYYLNLPVVKEWTLALPDDNDRQAHRVEFAIPRLPVGKYALLVSAGEKFPINKNSIAYAITWCSNLSCLNRTAEGRQDLVIMDRTTGEPMKQVQATVYSSQYNYSSRKYETRKGATYFSDNDGKVSIEEISDTKNFNIEFVQGADRLFLKDNFYLYPVNAPPVLATHTYFFTDRSIYRPGQTIYFKGIVLQTENGTAKIKPHSKTTVMFFDVNSQKVSELELVTNDYGTFNGTFTAPQGVLTGMMRIQNETGSLYFSVEEYKRPKFEVTFEPIPGSFMVNNRITIVARALSYSGAPVSDAGVTYRITRTGQFPTIPFFRKIYFPSSPETEIVNGTANTDSAGRVSLTFDALADPAISREMNPIFNFEVAVDVTDINGETHSQTTTVAVSYTALQITTDLKENADAASLSAVTIQSRNMAGNFEEAKGNAVIQRLEQPGRLLRERRTEAPDRHVMSRDEFEREFPHDVFQDEINPENWERKEIVFSSGFDTQIDSVLHLPEARKLKPGYYVLQITSHDRFSQPVKVTQYFRLIDPDEKEMAFSDYVLFIPLKSGGEPGEKARFLVGSRDRNIKLLYEIEENKSLTSSQWISLSNEQRLIEIPIKESQRGNFSVHVAAVRENRLYQFSQVINVPWSNKEIRITTATFRDKLKPGSKEEWKLKLSGKFADKFTAEMLASMYDASLDAMKSHNWSFDVWKTTLPVRELRPGSMFSNSTAAVFAKDFRDFPQLKFRQYDELNWFGYSPYSRYFEDGQYSRSAGVMAMDAPPMVREEEVGETAVQKTVAFVAPKVVHDEEIQMKQPLIPQVRTNFSETAFFFPTLYTNENNEVVFSFTMPDALTRWRFMALAHTKNLETGMLEKELITQKELMVVPNAPRFFREGDTLRFPCKISNLSDTSLSGTVVLSFSDAFSQRCVTTELLQGDSTLKFSVGKGGNTNASWNVIIPPGSGVLKYRVTAEANDFSDGEEQAIPVLTNSMLVTESLPLWANAGTEKEFSFDKLIQNNSSTLKHHKLSLEYTSNPAWLAIQSLPYLMEYPYECSEQIFSRYYANALASHIANSNPKIKSVFEAWKTSSKETFLSNLEKNQELKMALLEQTPWLLDAKEESENKKRIALLFDLNKMGSELGAALIKLQKKQNPGGSWSWFDGMPEDRYITQYIVEGFGHLDRLGVHTVRSDEPTWNMVTQAVRYLDRMIAEDYSRLLSSKADLKKDHLSAIQVHYLYTRSFFNDLKPEADAKRAYDYYLSQSESFWLEGNQEYMQGMIALALYRNKKESAAKDILKSLKENSQLSEELGRYWKNNAGGSSWSQAPVETQSLLIEAFHEINRDTSAVDEMQRWLLKNKQTNNWKTTKATAEACYALLLQGVDFLSESKLGEITLGNQKVSPPDKSNIPVEAGTGYFKTTWTGKDIGPELGHVKIKNENKVPGWGALYWQYFERLDKITSHETPLKLKKQVFHETATSTGKLLVPAGSPPLKTGDRVIVRIELRVDRDMEYVMMKDMRAAGLEPENVLSSYRWQDGLGYYESTHDASTDFFFSYLPKGTYVFEYPLRASQAGDYSNGITTIQCMYAPEFGSHSEGIRLHIGN